MAKVRMTIDLPPEQYELLKKLMAELDKSRNQIITEALSDYMKRGENEMKYGTVDFEGKTYNLKAQADFTNRVIPHIPNNFNDVENGEAFRFEMSAPAVDEEGNEYIVYWIFEDVKGDERELDSFDYDDVDRVEEL